MDYIGKGLGKEIGYAAIRVTVEKVILLFYDVDYSITALELHRDDIWSCGEECQIIGLFPTLEEAKNYIKIEEEWSKRWDY